ncbi:MAG: hypothetical protein JWN86_1373 [Planctomycetota bacterium]|nr:hypothetical protein [Planctomycetota bacterium]
MNGLSQHGSVSACKAPRKAVWKKTRKRRDTPQAWLRRLTCPFDFGLKVTTTDPKTKKSSSHPVHCNRNRDILAAFRDDRRWRYVDRLNNEMLDAHWDGDETFYLTGAGSSKCALALFNFDIDCHASGSPEGASEAAEYLKANFFLDLYHEPSTNGRGRHGYFILDKFGLNAEGVKELLKGLERRLNEHLLSKGFDIELFEIKGLPPVLTWGDDGEVTNYTAGTLAKIPREVHRFEEWKRTTVVTDRDVRRLMSRLRTTAPAEVSITPKPGTARTVAEIAVRGSMTSEVSAKPRASGSMTGKVIGEGELAQLAEGGHYWNVAASLMAHHTLRTTRRTIVRTEDVAIFLACLKFFTGRMNADGTLPVERFEGLWSAMYESGDVGRAFDCHRFKAIRDYLSGLGLLDWQDRTFVAPRLDRFGTRKKGRACKWRAGEALMEMLAWEKGVEVVGATQGEDVRDERREGEGEEEASLVGTHASDPSSPVCMKLNEVIRSLTRVAEGEEIRPIEQVEGGRKTLRLPSPEQLTLMVLDYEDSMERLAA